MSNEEPLLSDMDIGDQDPPGSPTDYQTISRNPVKPSPTDYTVLPRSHTNVQGRPPGGAGVGAEAAPPGKHHSGAKSSAARRPEDINGAYENGETITEIIDPLPEVGLRQPGGLPQREGPVGATTPLSPSETHLLVVDDMSDIHTTLVDPSEAGNVIMWNGARFNVTDFIKKEKGKRDYKRPISDFYCCLRVWSILGHFGVLVCLPVLLWLLFTRTGRELEETIENNLEHKLWFTTPIALCGIFLGLSYLLILCEVCISPTRPYMANLKSLKEAQSYVTQIRRSPFKIIVIVRCYHYEENSRMKSYKRVTYEERRDFVFKRCHDVSGCLQRQDFERESITKLRLRRVFGFLDPETEEKYKLFKDSLIEKNSGKDFYIETEEIIDMENLKDKVSIYVDDDSRPRCIQHKYYWLSAVCFMTLPFRYWFNRHTTETSFTVIKLIGGEC